MMHHTTHVVLGLHGSFQDPEGQGLRDQTAKDGLCQSGAGQQMYPLLLGVFHCNEDNIPNGKGSTSSPPRPRTMNPKTLNKLMPRARKRQVVKDTSPYLLTCVCMYVCAYIHIYIYIYILCIYIYIYIYIYIHTYIHTHYIILRCIHLLTCLHGGGGVADHERF